MYNACNYNNKIYSNYPHITKITIKIVNVNYNYNIKYDYEVKLHILFF